jgi:hypothetical protein
MWQISRKHHIAGAAVLFFVTAITMSVVATHWMSRVLQYTQGAAVEFYERISEEDCYVTTLGYKSYAHYFYAQASAVPEETIDKNDWLLHGDIDKPAYFVARISGAGQYDDTPDLKRLYERHGYVFFQRVPAKK